jgi:cobalt-zinc-cadmium efflux system protein
MALAPGGLYIGGMHTPHGGSHDHRGHASPQNFGRVFAIVIVLNLMFVAAEVFFGFLAGSLALLSDAAHNFSDIIGLALAGGAAWLGQHPPTAKRTYGYRSASILAALANAALLIAATGAIFLGAIERLADPQPIDSTTVMWVAALGAVINIVSAVVLMPGRTHDINVRGAFLHMAADAAVSVGVVIAALLIGRTGWLWIDPAISIVIAAVILWSCLDLTREALNLALGAVPAGVDRVAVEAYLRGLPGVSALHDLHIWAMSTTETALTVHLVMPGAGPHDTLLRTAAHELSHRYDIHHATLQIEAGVYECHLAPEHVV